MAIGSSFLGEVVDSVFDGTVNGDVAGTTVTGQAHNLTGALSAEVHFHADNQDATPEDNIRFDFYRGVDNGGSPRWEITPSDSVTLNLIVGATPPGIDPNSKQITLFPVPQYFQVRATRVNGGAGADTIRCLVVIDKQQGNPSA